MIISIEIFQIATTCSHSDCSIRFPASLPHDLLHVQTPGSNIWLTWAPAGSHHTPPHSRLHGLTQGRGWVLTHACLSDLTVLRPPLHLPRKATGISYSNLPTFIQMLKNICTWGRTSVFKSHFSPAGGWGYFHPVAAAWRAGVRVGSGSRLPDQRWPCHSRTAASSVPREHSGNRPYCVTVRISST